MPAGRAVWSGEDYASSSAHHRRLDEWFLARHPPRPTDVIVDAGCGSGEFTLLLGSLVPDGSVVGVEPDPSMLAQARQRLRAAGATNVEFRSGRLQDLDSACGAGAADLVVSRAVFHWIRFDEYPAAYDAVFRALRPGGWFHAESGGAGNVAAVKGLLDDVARHLGLGPAAVAFPDAGAVLDLVEQAGFLVPDGGVTTTAQRRPFDRAGLEGLLRTQAAIAYVAGATSERRDAFLAAALARVEELRRHDGSFDQTFVRLEVLCQRPA